LKYSALPVDAFFVVAVVLVLLGLLWWAQRARELFLVSVRDGHLLVVRGRIPAALLNDFRDALGRSQARRATVRALREPNGAQLVTRGLDDWTEQRLRNIFRVYPISNLRTAPVMERRSLGQVLGWVWLAWLMSSSRR
jgi:hypothetical protein